MTQNIAVVSEAAGQADQASGQVLDAANGLSSESERLKKGIETFLTELRKAL